MQQSFKVLVIRFSSIGDIVLTTPVVRALKQQCRAEVHYLTKRAYVPLLETNPYIDRIHAYEGNFREMADLLKAESFDQVVDLHKNLRTMRLRLRLGVPAHTFPKLNVHKYLLVQFKINTLPPLHIVDRYFKAVAPLGVSNDGHGLDYFIPPEVRQLEFIQLPYIAFAIGAAHATKRLPEHQIEEICKRITFPLVLVGGADVVTLGARLADKYSHTVINACGKTSLHQSALLLRNASVVVTHDTGMMHIAAALQKPIVSIWGNTIPAFGMYPYYGSRSKQQHQIVQVNDLSCRPCSKIGYPSCPKGHFKCMNDISTTFILKSINALISSSSESEPSTSLSC